jgi:hypothetical protein
MIKSWVLTLQNIDNLTDKLKQLDFTKQWEITVRERKPKRSLEQNDRLWDLYRSVGNYIGYSADDMHLLMGYKFLRDQKEINGTQVNVVKSTTSLNPKEMSDYQLMIESWASSLGWARNE